MVYSIRENVLVSRCLKKTQSSGRRAEAIRAIICYKSTTRAASHRKKVVGHVTQNTFNLFSQLTTKTLPDGSLTETRQYDPSGNLISLSHFNGVITSYTYDSLNRLLTRATPGEPAVSFTYTATVKYLLRRWAAAHVLHAMTAWTASSPRPRRPVL